MWIFGGYVLYGFMTSSIIIGGVTIYSYEFIKKAEYQLDKLKEIAESFENSVSED